MKNKFLIILFLSLWVASCNDFLDEAPDDRTEDINNRDKIRKLLVSAYPLSSFNLLTELASDNIEDTGVSNPYTRRAYEQMAYWKDITETDNDSPKELWESCYIAITNSNKVLKSIEKLGANNYLVEKGEALITRAYSHFVLVNVFSKHYNSKTSHTDLGIPYMKELETTLNPKYKRGTVKEVYEQINKDIEEALPLLKGGIYSKIKQYHFNRNAVFAFAARFNLYYGKWQKAINYASKVLSSASLRNWQGFKTLSRGQEVLSNFYINDESNLLMQTDASNLGLFFGPYYEGARFSHTDNVSREQTMYTNTPWGEVTNKSYNFVPSRFSTNNLDKLLFLKIPFLFEYTDAVAQVGYRRTVIASFTTDETLLVRAEAYALLGRFKEALNDLNTWSKNFYDNKKTTLKQIDDLYNGMEYSSKTKMTQKKKLKPAFSVNPGTQENLIHYTLQCRRILTLHEGMRWFDIKRYGIEVYRVQKDEDKRIVKETLTANDNRKAIQIPQDVISAGLEANPR